MTSVFCIIINCGVVWDWVRVFSSTTLVVTAVGLFLSSLFNKSTIFSTSFVTLER